MLENVKEEIIKYGKIAGDRGLSPGVSGNISIRYQDKIIITASGSASGFLSEDDIAIIDFQGNLIEGKQKASKEKLLHIAFYQKREDINAICHFHSPYMSAFAISGTTMDKKILPDIVFHFDEIPTAKYAVPGSQALVDNTSIYFDNHDAVIMENHGYIVGGKNIKDALLKAETCESYAKTLILSKILGGAKMLNEEQIREIYLLKN